MIFAFTDRGVVYGYGAAMHVRSECHELCDHTLITSDSRRPLVFVNVLRPLSTSYAPVSLQGQISTSPSARYTPGARGGGDH